MAEPAPLPEGFEIESRRADDLPDGFEEEPSFAERITGPISDFFRIQQEKAAENLDTISEGLSEDNKLIGAGKVALGTLGYLFSPLESASEAIVGTPIEKAMKEFGAPEPVAGFVGDLAKEAAFIAGPTVIGRAVSAARRSPAVTQALSEIRAEASLRPVQKVPDKFTVKATADDLLKSEILDKAGNINTRRLDTVDDVKATLSGVSKKYADEFSDATRGVVSQKETERLADTMGMTVEQLLKRTKGQAFNAHEALSARQMLVASADELTQAAKAAVGGGDEAIATFERSLARHVAIQEQVAGITAEAGRALNAFNISAKGNAKARALRELVDELGPKRRDFIDKIASLESPDEVAKFARGAYEATTSQKVVEAWINGLLSGPQTHAVNTLSNYLVAAWTVPEHMVAAGIGVLRGAGKSQKITAREAIARGYGFFEGHRDALKLAKHTFKTETPSDVFTKLEGVRVPAISGLKGKLIRTPGRALMAEDEFFKAIGRQMEIRSLAMRTGLSEGLKGRALAKRVSNLVQNPTDEMMEAAIHASRYQTFTNSLIPGGFGSAVMNFANAHPFLRFVIPFVRTPWNIVKFARDRTPLGLFGREVKDALKAGGVEADLARARMIFGSGVMGSVMYASAGGNMTGGGPTDPALRRALFAKGWQPYSIKVGDKYISYNRFEPIGILFGLASDMTEAWAWANKEEQESFAGLALASVTKNILDKTWISGVSSTLEAINDPPRYGEKTLSRFIGSFVPSILAQGARVSDPFRRSTFPDETEDPLIASMQTIIKGVQRRIPGYSKDLPPMRNMWGEPVQNQPGIAGVIPAFMTVDQKDLSSNEIVRLRIRPTKPKREIEGVKLTAREYDDYMRIYGRLAKFRIDRKTSDERWSETRDSKKVEIIEEEFRSAAKQARRLTLRENPAIFKRLERKRMKERRG